MCICSLTVSIAYWKGNHLSVSLSRACLICGLLALRSWVFIFNCVGFLASCSPYSRLCLFCKHVTLGHTMNKAYKTHVFVDLLVHTWQVAFPLLWAMLKNMQQPEEKLDPSERVLEPSLMMCRLSWGCLFLVFHTLFLCSAFLFCQSSWLSLSWPLFPNLIEIIATPPTHYKNAEVLQEISGILE